MNRPVYLLPVWDTITAAWDNIHGSKKSFWASLCIFFLIMFGFGILEGLSEGAPVIAWLFKSVANFIAYLIHLSMIYMGIKCAQNQPINFKMMFHTFDINIALRLIGLYALQFLLYLVPVIIGATGYWCTSLSGVLLHIFGLLLIAASVIFSLLLTVRISLSAAFVLDQNLRPWLAISKSLEATRGNFWSLIGLYILQLIIILASILPLLIGLIWTIPLTLTCYGMAYKRLRPNAQ